MAGPLTLIAVPGLPLVASGDDIGGLIETALVRGRLGLHDGDILCVAQKIVSKAEGRVVRLADVTPSAAAKDLATRTGKDPRVIELVLRESTSVLRAVPGIIVVRHRRGWVMANAGIDQSNAGPEGEDLAILLPEDPAASARAIRERLEAATGVSIGVIVTDSFGRAWRVGTVGVALGVAGPPAVLDLRGQQDLFGRTLRITEVGMADEIAAAASLLMGQSAEATPVVIVRGLGWSESRQDGSELIRPEKQDLFA